MRAASSKRAMSLIHRIKRAEAERDRLAKFDVIREKSLYGRKFMGIERSTFLFGPDGKLVREWRKVRVKGHAAEVLEAAKSL